MTYLVTQPCCADASCVTACPVDSIHPRPDSPAFAQADMLFINPDTCIECGACVDACPVNAIRHVSDLTVAQQRFVALNRRYFTQQAPKKTLSAQVIRQKKRENLEGLSVAIVGSGPSALYAAEHLIHHHGVRVDIFERLSEPFGLARYGLAPDHVHARQVTRQFQRVLDHDRVSLHLNTEIGRTLPHAALMQTHSAVIYATGAFNSKPYEVPGSELAHVYPASDFVGWYNSHPHAAPIDALPSGPAAAVVGAGNVALDVARLLLMGPADLQALSLAPQVKASLTAHRCDSVYLIGRSDPLSASFSYSELQAFLALDGVQVVFDERCKTQVEALVGTPEDPAWTFAQRMKRELYREILEAPLKDNTRRLVLIFDAAVRAFEGEGRVQTLCLDIQQQAPGEGGSPLSPQAVSLPVDLVVTATGFKGLPVGDLPFDAAAGTLVHAQGRVVDPSSHKPVRGVYTTGWIKRGPRGVIGSNKPCSLETVDALIADFKAGALAAPAA